MDYLCSCGHYEKSHTERTDPQYGFLYHDECNAPGCTCPSMRTVPWPFASEEERFWAVGCNPAKLAHRITGRWPGNDAYQAVCGASICLHAEFSSEWWPFPLGGMSFEDVQEIPDRYSLCLRCVEKDATVE